MKQANRPGRELRGFSLIEMMAAVAVAGVGVVALLYGIQGSLEADRRVEERRTALGLLQIKMAEYAQASQPMAEQTGAFDSPYEAFDWRAEVKPTELPGLFLVETEVSWQGRKETRHIRAQTLAPRG